MINLFKLIKLHFNIEINIEVENLLNEELFLKPEDLAVYIYRVQNKLIDLYGEKGINDILQALSYIQRMYTQIEIYYSAKIGKDFKLIHGVGTVIGARAVIGDYVTIFQNVTLGDIGLQSGKPIIEDNVYIYSGSSVLGNIRIGHHSIIGANSLVLESCPKNSILVGTPAKIINNNGYEKIKRIKTSEKNFMNEKKDSLNIFDFNYYKYLLEYEL